MKTENQSILDWLNLIVDALIPLFIALIAIYAKKYVDDLEKKRYSYEVATSWRLEIFRQLSENMNILRQFHCYVGEWKNISVSDARKAKRACDALVFGNEYLWGHDFTGAWRTYNEKIYREDQGLGADFKFRSNIENHRHNLNWDEEWINHFVDPSERIKRSEYTDMSSRILQFAARQIGILEK